jgi:hypothetical protein
MSPPPYKIFNPNNPLFCYIIIFPYLYAIAMCIYINARIGIVCLFFLHSTSLFHLYLSMSYYSMVILPSYMQW